MDDPNQHKERLILCGERVVADDGGSRFLSLSDGLWYVGQQSCREGTAETEHAHSG